MSADYTQAGGPRLAEYLAGIPIETRWLAGHHVVWTTGQQDRLDGLGPEDATHCSAFVAAAALGLDRYVLRPPNHSQELLANAQVDWLNGAGRFAGPDAATSGWIALGLSGDPDALADAVARANAGQLVLAGYAQPPATDPVTGVESRRPGHIVLMPPQDASGIGADGPLVMSAGATNDRQATTRAAFAHHAGAWPSSIALFACDTGLEADSPAGTY